MNINYTKTLSWTVNKKKQKNSLYLDPTESQLTLSVQYFPSVNCLRPKMTSCVF